MGFFTKLFSKQMDALCAPVAGNAVPVSQVPDPTFAEEILGKGIAVEPTEGKVYAPCDATVDMMFETGHAVSLVADFGAEVLIHVGLETVSLKGKHFTVHAASGDKVKKGDLLIEFDLDAIKAEGFNTITPMLVCNSGDYSTIKTHVGKAVTNADVVIELAK
ncbi:MAG: PTS glucose transporter subunit IIA [Firmicutes bacterium]|nr:PTS glucose transporter subunit IIA [Bacillota bacterium]